MHYSIRHLINQVDKAANGGDKTSKDLGEKFLALFPS
jgi:hypothetical protein